MNFLNNTSNDSYSSILKFLDCSSLNTLHKSNNINRKNVIKYKIIYKEIKIKNIFGGNTCNLLKQKYNISYLYKNRNSVQLSIESFKIWLEEVCKNKKMIDFSEYYGLLNFILINHLELIIYRNNIIKKYFTEKEIKNKNNIIKSILYITKNITSKILNFEPFIYFYEQEYIFWNSLDNNYIKKCIINNEEDIDMI